MYVYIYIYIYIYIYVYKHAAAFGLHRVIDVAGAPCAVGELSRPRI